MSSTLRTIEIVAYDPRWPAIFAELSRVVARALGPLALSIEHVGSTSVPGLGAKPIVDMDVVIASRSLLPDVLLALAPLGYIHQGDLGIAGREALVHEGPDVPRDGSGRVWPAHHLYVCAQDNAELARHLALRGYLRAHPESALAYGELKRRLARQFPHDIEAYIEGKAAFIQGILDLAQGK